MSENTDLSVFSPLCSLPHPLKCLWNFFTHYVLILLSFVFQNSLHCKYSYLNIFRKKCIVVQLSLKMCFSIKGMLQTNSSVQDMLPPIKQNMTMKNLNPFNVKVTDYKICSSFQDVRNLNIIHVVLLQISTHQSRVISV